MELIFQQLFESTSSTYTYLLADARSREAVLIDPVLETADRDLSLVLDLDLELRYILETHVHADHVTGAARLRAATEARIAMSAVSQADGIDVPLRDGDALSFGAFRVDVLATPGHTHSCLSYLVGDRVFTGDALLIRGNGRTDFQQGSAETLYKSITEKLFTLPDATLVYPGHDYKGFTSSTIGIEKKLNPRIGGGRSLTEFVRIMAGLGLAPPKKIDIAVPANLKCGRV